MGVGACTISNDPAELKDLFIQARINGKSWKQIQEEFGFSSVQVARKTFRKVTGINDLKIKGKALKNVIDKGMIDTLKAGVAKKPPVGATGASAPSVSASATSGAQGGLSQQVATLGDDVAKTMSQAFPLPSKAGKIVLNDIEEVFQYSNTYAHTRLPKVATKMQSDLVDTHGISKVNAILDDLKAGKYYSDIVNKHGVSFADVDAVFWSDSLLTNIYNQGGAKSVWNAYKAKPTSEFGFKAVQDQVWELKKLGASQGSIVSATGIDDNVVKLILDNKWSLPGKGSKQYVGFPSYGGNANLPSSYSSSQQTAAQIVGESNSFSDMTKAQADAWVQQIGQDLNAAQVREIKRYTGPHYSTVNDPLRGRHGLKADADVLKKADVLSSTMRPLPENVTLRRGVGADTFPNGIPDVGMPWSDPGFMSSSYGGSAGFSSKPIHLVIDAPKGTLARPVHMLSGLPGEREILLNRNQRFIITGVKRFGNRTEVYMRIVL